MFVKIEGTFQLEVPVVLLGYSHAPQDTPNTLPQTLNHLQGLATSTHTYLQLFVTVEPPLSVLPPIKNKVIIVHMVITIIIVKGLNR